jgi:hypothetical protein
MFEHFLTGWVKVKLNFILKITNYSDYGDKGRYWDGGEEGWF